MSEQMWSLDEEGRIFELLKSVVENRNYVNVWQRSTKNTTQARGVIKDLDRSKCTIAFSKKIGRDFFVSGETLYIHCEGIDIIFKKENFSADDGTVVFKTPTKLLVKEKRRIERLRFKYQDFKEVEFSFSKEGTVHKTKQMLIDISILGIGFIAPKSLAANLEVGDVITIHMMSDQKLEADSFKAKIVNRIENEERDKYSDDYIKYGVEFEEPLEIVIYQSKDLVAPKTQRKNSLVPSS